MSRAAMCEMGATLSPSSDNVRASAAARKPTAPVPMTSTRSACEGDARADGEAAAVAPAPGVTRDACSVRIDEDGKEMGWAAEGATRLTRRAAWRTTERGSASAACSYEQVSGNLFSQHHGHRVVSHVGNPIEGISKVGSRKAGVEQEKQRQPQTQKAGRPTCESGDTSRTGSAAGLRQIKMTKDDYWKRTAARVNEFERRWSVIENI